jgi:hypothetical protein
VSGVDGGANRVVGHWQDGVAHAERAGQFIDHAGQVHPGRESTGAFDMHGEVAISEPEPVFSTELREHVHEVPALAGSTPTGVYVAEFGEGVHQRVDVGRDMQSQVLKIVPGVDHETELVRIQQPAQSKR